ncbi:Protein translocase subunit SecDF [subsurface metagenome]
MDKNRLIKLLAIILIIGLAFWQLYPSLKYYRLSPEERELEKELRDRAIHLGLDLQGGMHLVLEVDTKDMAAREANSAVEGALIVIRRRIEDKFPLLEPKIQRQGKNRIIIQLPGIRDPERAKELIGKTALLEFKIVKDRADSKERLLEKLSNEIPLGCYIPESKEEEVFLVEKEPVLTGEELSTAAPKIYEARPEVSLKFTRKGAGIFKEVTGKHVGEQLAIILDDVVYSAPVIREKITGGEARITGRFTMDEAKDLANVLRHGALPAAVNKIEERTVGPSLGLDSINKGVRAAILGLALIALFMLLYYRFSGLIANFALFLTLLLLLATLTGFGLTLTLPGIAGIILTIGMAVDANVLIFERMKEELRSGKSIRASVEGGYTKAFLTIMDANVTTLIAALVLFQFGTGPVKGFAVTLSIGILASMFSALVVSRAIFEFLTSRRRFKRLSMASLIGPTKIDFINRRKIAFAFSILLIVVGLVSFVTKGEDKLLGIKKNFGIDFRGGSLVQLRFASPISANEGRKALSEIGLGASTIQQFDTGKGMIIRSTKDAVTPIVSKFSQAFKLEEVQRREMVGPEVGRDLRKAAFLALFWALIGILIYIAWRFEFRFAIAAVIALFHDVLITIGAFSLTGREFSLPIIAALLTIVGYSLNDTIVVFDRIRRNAKILRKEPYEIMVNTSINETLSRTLLTSLTTLVVVLCLFFLGGEVIHDFAFALLVGITVGTYSSIFVASPILVAWQKRARR